MAILLVVGCCCTGQSWGSSVLIVGVFGVGRELSSLLLAMGCQVIGVASDLEV